MARAIKRLTEPQFNALLGTNKMRDKVRLALRECVVNGESVTSAAFRWGVSRAGVYRAYDSLFRGNEPETQGLVAVTTYVPAAKVGEFKAKVSAQLRFWTDEAHARALAAAQLSPEETPAVAYTPAPRTPEAQAVLDQDEEEGLDDE